MNLKDLRRIYLDYVLDDSWKADAQEIKDLQKFDEDGGCLPRTDSFIGALARVVRKYCRPDQVDDMYDSALESWFEPEEQCRK